MALRPTVHGIPIEPDWMERFGGAAGIVEAQKRGAAAPVPPVAMGAPAPVMRAPAPAMRAPAPAMRAPAPAMGGVGGPAIAGLQPGMVKVYEDSTTNWYTDNIPLDVDNLVVGETYYINPNLDPIPAAGLVLLWSMDENRVTLLGLFTGAEHIITPNDKKTLSRIIKIRKHVGGKQRKSRKQYRRKSRKTKHRK
jgi:hypothetical protein